jgi:hypothetical protein
MSVFMGLTMADLVALMGHDHWKAISAGDSLIIANLEEEPNIESLEARFSEKIGPCQLTTRISPSPGGPTVQLITINKVSK